ncbi:MAG TPA: rRNA maturation RNase YbeY [Stellaceae bacterium]|nr:rRNA maturation RNase YbeY [Stellaceae bacterium]
MIEPRELSIEPTVEVSALCPGWERECAEAAVLAETAARLALRLEGAPDGAVAEITLADDEAQRALNRIWRGKDASTNVLAFPATDPATALPRGAPLLLGDVVLALETVSREAGEQEKPFEDHLRHLVVHGVLHLLGYNHEDERDAAVMEAREIAVLAELGVPNPYRDTI